jgi:hypothetical protein
MIDYRGVYEDLLTMERRAKRAGKFKFAESCRQFRMDLLLRFYHPVGRASILGRVFG